MVYHNEVWQDLFDHYANKIDFKQGVPNVEDLKEYQNAFVILDDLMFVNAEFLAKIYSVYSHHFRFSVLMTVKNLFHEGLCEISLNSQMIVLFKNCRDTNQIAGKRHGMPPINTFDIVLFSAQILVIYIVVSISLYNLTQSNDNKELWISLLSSSVGYLLPSPFLSKHVSHPPQ